MGEWTTIKGKDGEFRAYLARPTAPSNATVVLAQEIFGVNAGMRRKADWLAQEGFSAIAPDLFWRLESNVDISDQTEAEWAKAMDLMKRFDIDAGVRDLQSTIAAARSSGAAKVGALGYCLGGLLAFLIACRSDVDASVGYYGVNIDAMIDEARNLRKPLTLHIADEDSFSSKEARATIDSVLGSNGLVTLHHYSGRDHAFTREGGKNYNAESAAQADARTVAFFKHNLA